MICLDTRGDGLDNMALGIHYYYEHACWLSY